MAGTTRLEHVISVSPFLSAVAATILRGVRVSASPFPAASISRLRANNLLTDVPRDLVSLVAARISFFAFHVGIVFRDSREEEFRRKMALSIAALQRIRESR